MSISEIVISSRVRLARNLKNVPFPNKLSDFDVASSVSKAIFEVFGEDFEFRNLKNLSSQQCLLLLEKHIISKELIDNKDISSYALSPDETISIMINEEDHIREQCIIKGFDLKNCFETINRVDETLLSKLEVAFSSKLGFLTCCPSNLGTGMRASVMLFLPALTMSGAIKLVIDDVKKDGLTVRGLYGEGSACEGYFYQISNQVTLGVDEKEIIKLVSDHVKKIIEMEENSQKSLIKTNENVIKDMALRAYGTLNNCYILGLSECIELLSKVRLGVITKLLKLKKPQILDELYSQIQPSHLMNYYELELSDRELDLFRAKFVGDSLEKQLIKGV